LVPLLQGQRRSRTKVLENQKVAKVKPRSGNIRHQSREASEEIRRYVVEGIAEDRLKPGDRLPTERELAAQFRAARNTVRRALTALEEEGKIERHVGRGTFVTGLTSIGSRWLTSGGTLPPLALNDNAINGAGLARLASPLDVVELREAWEPKTAALAALRATPAEIERMQDLVESSRVISALQEFEELDGELHQAIALSTRNPLFIAVAAMVTAVREQAEWAQLKRLSVTKELRHGVLNEHMAIVEAIRQRTPAVASEAMTAHLVTVRRTMFGG
jgi:DNA-binding FadR family transcriptional regulator